MKKLSEHDTAVGIACVIMIALCYLAIWANQEFHFITL